MKRFMLLVGVAVVAAAMYVAASGASGQASGPTAKQFAALKKQVVSLTKSLKQVKAEATDADGFVRTCLVTQNSGVVPINRFGDPNGTFGYQYFDGTQTTDTTALDVDGSANPAAYIQGVDPSCVSAGLKHHTGAGAGGLLLRAERAH